MNTKNLFCILAFLALSFLPACSPMAPAPTMIAYEPRQPASSPPLYAPTASAEEGNIAPVPPIDNNFKDYGVNPEVAASYDHLSTFGLDVDTASYTVTRSYLTDGNLPPYDAVRVEEFVNSFDQGYSAPKGAAFAIYADGARAPQGFDESSYILRFGVQGYKVDDSERKPAVLTFVIDVSGSMDMENRLELVKRSLRMLVDRLDERDSVVIVVYGSDARAVLEPTNGSRHGVIMDAINRLEPEGSTNMEAGLRLGYRYAQKA
ncbi:MAG: VWA domain-containing protein, partial [Chloroflexi bacterium]